MHRVHGVVHCRMVPHEVDDLVGVVFGGLHVGGESSPGALRRGKRSNSQEKKKKRKKLSMNKMISEQNIQDLLKHIEISIKY